MIEDINIPDKLVAKTVFFDYKTPVGKVFQSLDKYKAVIITKNKEYYGIVDSKSIYRAGHSLKLPSSESIGKYAVRVPRITNSTAVDDVVYYFYSARVRALPFMNGDKIGGILERNTLLKMLLSLGALESLQVREAMTTPVLAIDSNANVSEAFASMHGHNVDRLAVLQGGKFTGLVTGYDIMRKFAVSPDRLPEGKTKSYSPSNVPVSSIMVSNVVSIPQDLGISDAVRQFIEHNISSLLVTKNAAPIGIITVFDVLENIMVRKRIHERRVYVSGFDSYTYQYQDDLREALNKFMSEIEKLHGMHIDYITLRIKGKPGAYQLYVRLSLRKNGIISIHVRNYRFEAAFADLLKKLKVQVFKEKSYLLTMRKVNLLREGEAP